MKIKPYKQSLAHSCLAASLMMLTKQRIRPAAEEKICLRGSKRIYPFYVVGVPFEFSKYFSLNLTVHVDNKFFTGVVKEAFKKNKKIEVIHEKIDLGFLRELTAQSPVVCHIDDHFLGDYSHSSHFIVIERFHESKVTIIDPYHGERRLISQRTLWQSIQSLKNHIKMCPVVFQI